MSSPPFMQLYVSDYLGATLHFTSEQHGAYMLLLLAMWNAGGSLPDDAKTLCRITRCSPSRWGKISDAVMEKFDRGDGRISNPRLTRELEKAQEKSIKRAEVGSRGGKAKALKDNAPALAIATGLPCHSPEPEPEPEKKDDLKVIVGGADPASVRKAFERWNALAVRLGLPVAKDLTPERRKHIANRLKGCGEPGWMEALAAVEASPLCRGENDRGWRADLDFVCQPKSFNKLREGSYAPKAAATGPPPPLPVIDRAARLAQLESADVPH